MMNLLKRELIVTLVIIVATVALLFPITYLVGARTFGGYAEDGSLGSYLGSLFSALANGEPAIWFFMLTPLLAISILRIGLAIYRQI